MLSHPSATQLPIVSGRPAPGPWLIIGETTAPSPCELMPEAPPHRLPVALQMWHAVGRFVSPEVQLDVAGRLARRWVKPGLPYRTMQGFALSIDSTDPFQAAMAAGLFSRHGTWLIDRHTRAGGTAIDVGAHLGYFTLQLARLVGSGGAVHAFEPDPRVYPRLVAHLELNKMTWVTPNEFGLLDRSLDNQPLTIFDQLGWSSVLPGAQKSDRSVPVSMRTLDDYVEEHDISPPDICFVKIDVEGAELEVLHGAKNTLRQATSAAVLVEHVPGRAEAAGYDPGGVAAFMSNLGFEPHIPVRRHGRFLLRRGANPEFGFDVLFSRP